jgi:hypothetical protein
MKGENMTALVKPSVDVRRLTQGLTQMLFKLTHNGFALLGVAVAFVAIALIARPDLRQSGEAQLAQWLQERISAQQPEDAEPNAIERATATTPKELPREQAAVAYWLSRKYRVAPEPLGALVAAAYEVGRSAKLDPTLILAIMAVESSFNPFAQSPVGAQGLMQVMTRVHADKYQHFGGPLAAFDPVTNLRVGVKVLQECIARAGSLQGGLKLYVGAGNDDNDGGYASKVLSEHARLQQVAQGRPVPLTPPQTVAAGEPRATTTPAAAPAADTAHAADQLAG